MRGGREIYSRQRGPGLGIWRPSALPTRQLGLASLLSDETGGCKLKAMKKNKKDVSRLKVFGPKYDP